MKSDLKKRYRLALLLGLLLTFILAACAPPPAVQTRSAESVPPVRQTDPESEPTDTSETAMLPIVSGGEPAPATTEPAEASAPTEAVEISLPEDAVRVQFDLGEVEKVLTGTLEEGEVDTFVLRANGGEPLLIDLISEDETMQLSLYGRGDGIPLIHEISNVRRWSGRLPQAQEYILHVTADGITVAPATGAEDETGDAAKTRVGKVAAQAGTPYEIHISQPQRVGFAPGQTTAVVAGNLAVGQIAPYVVNVAQGQLPEKTNE